MSALPAVVGAATVVGATASMITYGITGRSARLFGPSVYRGPGVRRSIALTFDDGPCPSTPTLLEFLRKEQILATFFQCGMNVERNPLISREVHAGGHEIGNHTYSHPHLYLKKPGFVEREIRQGQQSIGDCIGVAPTLLRAPYGLKWFGMRRAQKELRLLGVMWTVIGHDWEWPSERVANFVLQKSSPGGIICLHDGRGIQPKPNVSTMLEALKRIVPALREQGYSFETVSSLLR